MEIQPIFIDGTGADSVLDEYKSIIKPNAPEGTKVLLEVGDMLVYSGCDLEHWRGLWQNICMCFTTYNHVNGPFAEKNKFDGRPMLGLPSFVNSIIMEPYTTKIRFQQVLINKSHPQEQRDSGLTVIMLDLDMAHLKK